LERFLAAGDLAELNDAAIGGVEELDGTKIAGFGESETLITDSLSTR